MLAGGTFSMQGGSLVSAQHGALKLQANASLDIGGGAVLSGGNGVLLQVDAALANVGLALDGASHAEGDIVINPVDLGNGVPVSVDVDVRLLGGSRWQGASNVLDALELQGGSQWTLTGDSQLNTLSLDGSTLQLSAADGGRFNTLTVAGDFSSAGGVLYFNGALGNDAAPTDRLHVQGDTAGSADVFVGNVGGRGAQTRDGIQIIQVDGVSEARFNLAGRAVAGRYEYFLHKGGKADPGDGDWYLRSEMLSEEEHCELDPGAPGCAPVVPPPEGCDIDPGLPACVPPVPDPEPDPRPVLRPEPGAYLANQTAAVQMFGQRHHDRGDRVDGQDAWTRMTRTQANYGVIGDQLGVNGDTQTLQLGTDVWAWGAGRGQLGVMAGQGTANNRVTSRLTGYSAKGKVRGNMLGVYASWLQQSPHAGGLYLEGSLQYARFDNTVQGDALARERYDSRASTVAAEAGYGVKVFDSGRSVLFVEPQVQLSYRRLDADALTETNGTRIDGSDADGLSRRVGVRLSGHATTQSSNRVQPFVAVNWMRESSDNRLRFDGEQLAGGLPKHRYEAKAGAQLKLGDRWSAWGDFGLQRGDGGYKEVAGQFGLRAGW